VTGSISRRAAARPAEPAPMIATSGSAGSAPEGTGLGLAIVQSAASRMGAQVEIVEGGAGEPLRHFGTVGIVAAGATISSLWLAAHIRPTA
jgi:signal transduction histidine kinase